MVVHVVPFSLNSRGQLSVAVGSHAVKQRLQEEAEPEGCWVLHFAHYNFVRIHPSLRVTPTMAVGVSDRLWFIEQLIDLAIDGRDVA